MKMRSTVLGGCVLPVLLLLVAAAWRTPPQELRSFQTPSGNIGCMADRTDGQWSLRCDVAEHNWNGVHPRGCDLDSGDALGLGRAGRPYWVCHGDTVLRQGAVLAYGATWHAGPFSCVSAREGVTCRNAAHGFMLSRARYSVW